MQDMAMTGLSRGWIGDSNLLIPVACKVSINMQVKGMIVIRLYNEAYWNLCSTFIQFLLTMSIKDVSHQSSAGQLPFV